MAQHEELQGFLQQNGNKLNDFPFFAGMEETERKEAVYLMQTETVTYRKGEFVHLSGEP